jgi:signal transduction histidine kinase/ActR/RegA family two-component response regulator
MRKGGERFYVSGITTALRDEDGTLRGFVKICRDLTERQTIQDQRDRLLDQEKLARLEAERAMVMRDEFLAVVSHELRTPLTAILLWAKMLRSGALREAEYAEAFTKIEMSAESQRQLIEDLLDVSRMMSGKLRLNIRECELLGVVRAATDAVRPMADAKKIEMVVTLDERAGRVMADPDRIQQVVWNLLNNAVKFSKQGGRVSVQLKRVDSVLQIQVADTGRGISAAFLPHVFERFRQADASTTRTEGGLGLGLSISNQLVELHGGTIRAESRGVDQGSTFTVELPMADVRTQAGYRRPSNGGPAALTGTIPADTLQGMRLLVVEDEANSRSAIQILLKHSGADVAAVESAALAVAAFRESLIDRPFDAIVSDIGMPIQNGYELMREIRQMEISRQEKRHVPAIAMTAYAREEDRVRALAAGFQAHIPKPIDLSLLVGTLNEVTGRAGD